MFTKNKCVHDMNYIQRKLSETKNIFITIQEEIKSLGDIALKVRY